MSLSNPHGKTGRPIAHKLASVTVMSPSAMHADAMATGLMVLGAEAGYELAEQQGLAALFIIKTENGFVDRTTTTFKQYTAG